MPDPDTDVRSPAPGDWRDEWVSDDDIGAPAAGEASRTSEVISLTRAAVEHALEAFPTENEGLAPVTAIHDWVVPTSEQPVSMFELRPAMRAPVAVAAPAEIPLRANPASLFAQTPRPSHRGVVAAVALAAVILCVGLIGYRSSIFPAIWSRTPQSPAEAVTEATSVTRSSAARSPASTTDRGRRAQTEARPGASNALPTRLQPQTSSTATTAARSGRQVSAPAPTLARGRSAGPASPEGDPTTPATLARIRTEATERAAREAMAATPNSIVPSAAASPATGAAPVSAPAGAIAPPLPPPTLPTGSTPAERVLNAPLTGVSPIAPRPTATSPSAAAPAAVTTAPTERQAIDGVLGRYRAAMNQLDAGAAQAVWPTVDGRALDRAFGQLDSQTVAFNSCSVSVIGQRATARCSGNTTYVPKVGNRSPRSEPRQWVIDLRKTGDRWLISGVDSQ